MFEILYFSFGFCLALIFLYHNVFKDLRHDRPLSDAEIADFMLISFVIVVFVTSVWPLLLILYAVFKINKRLFNGKAPKS